MTGKEESIEESKCLTLIEEGDTSHIKTEIKAKARLQSYPFILSVYLTYAPTLVQ